jgi:hypothetical protein
VSAAGDVLRAAAQLIRDRGWTQAGGDLRNRECAFTAIHAADLEHRLDGRAFIFMRDRLRSLGWQPGRHTASIIEWNDAPGRTAEEVLEALEQAAALADLSEADLREEVTAERTAANPDFPDLVADAVRRRADLTPSDSAADPMKSDSTADLTSSDSAAVADEADEIRFSSAESKGPQDD